MSASEADELFQEYLNSADPHRAERLLETLLAGHAQPVVGEIARQKLALPGVSEQDIKDFCLETLASLGLRLREIRDSGAGIGSFMSYAAAAAHHGCHDRLRSLLPNRHRLEARLRYLLGDEKGLAVWEDDRGEWLCGFVRWQSEHPAPAPATRDRIESWRSLLADVPSGRGGLHPADLAFTLFERFGAPLPFDSMVDIVAALWGVEDPPGAPTVERVGGDSDPISRGESKRWLARLWAALRGLSSQERAALLLHLRTATGRSALWLFPIAGVAGLDLLADALDLPIEELAAVWSSLPLNDRDVAARLGVPRARAIELRTWARERVARVMAS